jgi:hypothetical protein
MRSNPAGQFSNYVKKNNSGVTTVKDIGPGCVNATITIISERKFSLFLKPKKSYECRHKIILT